MLVVESLNMCMDRLKDSIKLLRMPCEQCDIVVTVDPVAVVDEGVLLRLQQPLNDDTNIDMSIITIFH